MERRKELAIIVFLAGILVLPSVVWASGSNVLLWNRLGSDVEVTNSEIGPDGTIVGDISYFPGKFGNGFKPDIRTGDRNIPDNYVRFDGLNLGQEGTIEFWFQPDWIGGWSHIRCILNYGKTGRAPIAFEYNDWQDKLNIGLWNEDVNDSNYVGRYIVPSSTPEWSTTEPFHIAIVWDGTAVDNADKIKLYLNGNERGTLVGAGSPTFADWSNDNYLHLACRINEGDWARHNWEGSDGVIDNLKIWDFAKADFSDRFEEGVPAGPMGTVFTYQGRLIDANSPADGWYDFEFELYDGPAVGNQIGSAIDADGIDIIEGYFTVELDFGNGVFDGDARWLEIGVRPGELEDPNTCTTLSPRQELTPTPYAIHAKTAETAGGEGMPSGVIVMWSGSIANIPAGWALCDGSDGTPDLTDRFILSVAAAEDPGATGGNHNYTLSTDQLPSHSHTFTTNSAGSHTHSCVGVPDHNHGLGSLVLYYKQEGIADYGDINGSPHFASQLSSQHTQYGGAHSHGIGSAGSHSHSGTTTNTGGDQPFDNRPAYYKLAFIMKL